MYRLAQLFCVSVNRKTQHPRDIVLRVFRIVDAIYIDTSLRERERGHRHFFNALLGCSGCTINNLFYHQYRGLLHQILRIQHHTILFKGCCCQTDGRDGGQADIAEGRVDAELRAVDNLSNHLHQFPLQVVLWCFHLKTSSSLPFLRLWQRPFIDLLILVQGNTLNLHRCCRHHIGWFPFQDEVVQRIDVYLLITYDIGGNELTATFLIKGLHRDVLNAREFFNNTFHLTHLNTETANLHLSVATTNELQITVWKQANNITRAVAARVGTIPMSPISLISPMSPIKNKRIRSKCLSVLLWSVQVATSHLRTTDPKFTLLPVLHQLSLLVNHIEA